MCLADGYGGDDRGFTTRLDVTSRMRAEVRTVGGKIIAATNSDPSHWLGLSAVSIPRTSWVGNSRQFLLDIAGANPLLPGAPDIDLHLNLSIQRTGNVTCFQGDLRGDAFPSAEVFVTGLSQSKMLHTFATSGGQETGGLLLLPFDHKRLMGTFNPCVGY